jgi:drug/metabolite transporter (DMT)-like permease
MVALAFAMHRRAPLKTKRRGLSWARSLLGTASMLATFYAVSSPELGVSAAVTLFSTAPIFIALLSPHILGERPGAGLWAILVVAFGGIVLVAGTQVSVSVVPAVVAILAALFGALAMMFLRIMRSGRGDGDPESAEAIALHFGLVAFVAHAALGAFTFRMPDIADIGWLFVTGLSGGLAQLAMTKAYALTTAARLGAVGYLGTVMGFLGSVIFLHERPTLLQIGGSLLVVGAGVVLAVTTAAKTPIRGTAL